MPRHTFRCPMRWSDMDAYGHVNNVQFLTYLEEARIDLLGELFRRAEADDGAQAGMLVASSSIEYRAPLVHRAEPVPIDVWVTRFGGASFDLGYAVHDGAGTTYATAASRLVTYDFAAAQPRRLRPHEREFFARHLD